MAVQGNISVPFMCTLHLLIGLCSQWEHNLLLGLKLQTNKFSILTDISLPTTGKYGHCQIFSSAIFIISCMETHSCTRLSVYNVRRIIHEDLKNATLQNFDCLRAETKRFWNLQNVVSWYSASVTVKKQNFQCWSDANSQFTNDHFMNSKWQCVMLFLSLVWGSYFFQEDSYSVKLNTD